MAAYTQGISSQYTAMNAGVLPDAVHGVAINWFVNRCPLATRLPQVPLDSPQFSLTNDDFRPRSHAVDADINNSVTSVVVADASSIEPGDVLQIEDEYVLVTAVNTGTNALTITRAYAGTTAAAHTAGKAITLISNTRTGAEVEVAAISRIPAIVTQYAQTIQHAYQVGGALQASAAYVSGHGTPLDRDRMAAMQHCMDDFESAMYYGKGVAIAAPTTRPLMKGLSSLIVTNRTTSPTNAAAYKQSDLIRDTVQKCFDGGGNPNLLLVSTDFLSGLSIWGTPAVRLEAGATKLGVSIDLFRVPFLAGQLLIPAPLLRPGTVICLSAAEAQVFMKRALHDKPRGSRGDATEGDLIMEGAIGLSNERHHAMVSGITGFSAS